MTLEVPSSTENGSFFEVGDRLQAVRRARGLSQRELARRANLTNGSLSMIEQGKVSPSISSLEKILNVIPMTLTEFFSDTLFLSSPVFRLDNFEKVSAEGFDASHAQFSTFNNADAALHCQTYSPGAVVTADWLVKDGFVAGILVRGVLSLSLDGEKFELVAGEGFHFSVQRSHKLQNIGDVEAELIAVSVATV